MLSVVSRPKMQIKIAFGYKMGVGKDEACSYLIKKYGDTDDQGNISIPTYINVIKDENDKIVSGDVNPKFVEFQNSFNTLLQEERDLEYKPLPLEDFESVESDANYTTFFKLIKVDD